MNDHASVNSVALGRRFAREFVPIIPLLPQRQDSLSDQLDDLERVATRLGMYDAADFIHKASGLVPRARQ